MSIGRYRGECRNPECLQYLQVPNQPCYNTGCKFYNACEECGEPTKLELLKFSGYTYSTVCPSCNSKFESEIVDAHMQRNKVRCNDCGNVYLPSLIEKIKGKDICHNCVEFVMCANSSKCGNKVMKAKGDESPPGLCDHCKEKKDHGICTSCGNAAYGRPNSKGWCIYCQTDSYSRACAAENCTTTVDTAIGDEKYCFQCSIKMMRGKCLKCGNPVGQIRLDQQIPYCSNCEKRM